MSILRDWFKKLAVGGIAVAAVALASCGGQHEKIPSDTARLADKVTKLETKLAYLDDRQQIHDVYMRYMRGFDRQDLELMKSAFWPDAQINYSFKSSSVDDFAAVHWAAHRKISTLYGHLLTNESVALNGDVAHVETYVTQFSTLKDGAALTKKKESKSLIVAGRYIDRLDRRNGEWRIAVREFIPHFFTETNVGLDSDFRWPRSECGRGTWDRHDPSYRRPLTARTNPEAGLACAE